MQVTFEPTQRPVLTLATIAFETDKGHGCFGFAYQYREDRIPHYDVSQSEGIPFRCFIAIRVALVRPHVKLNEIMAGCLENT